jgi:hypothetical protein
MATVSSLAKAVGNAGNPGKKPYFVEVEIDLAAAATAKGSALVATDVIEAITVPAGHAVMFAGMEVVTAPAGGTAATVALGITGGDVDAFAAAYTITGAAAGAYAPMASTACPIAFASSDTIDMLLAGTTIDTSGVIRVYAYMMDIDGMGGSKAAAEVDRDTLA